jgi:hypothetical protein
MPVLRAQPSVLAPDHFLDCSLASQHAAAAIGQRPADKINHVGVTAGRFDEIGMAGALQCRVRAIPRGQDMGVGMNFVWTGQVPRARQSHRVIPISAALGSQKVIPASALVDVRAFREAERRAIENLHPLTDELPLRDRVFLEHDAAKRLCPGRWSQSMLTKVLLAIVVVEKRRVETATVHIDRVGPLAIDSRAGDEIVVKIAQRGAGGTSHGSAAKALLRPCR